MPMNWKYKRQFHEWANSVSFDEVLGSCEPGRNGVDCLYCYTEENVYMLEWKNDTDFFCIDCLKEFLGTELPETKPTGLLRQRFVVFSRDDFKCVYCGRNPRDHDTTLEIEHVLPSAKGGGDSLKNLVTACKECNAGKGDYLLDQRQRNLVTRRAGE